MNGSKGCSQETDLYAITSKKWHLLGLIGPHIEFGSYIVNWWMDIQWAEMYWIWFIVHADRAECERLPSFELLEEEESDSYSSEAEGVVTTVQWS